MAADDLTDALFGDETTKSGCIWLRFGYCGAPISA